MKNQSQTINLTRVREGNHYDNILKRKFTYDEDVKRRLKVNREFLEQKGKAEKLHYERSVKLISDVIDDVKKFVSKALDLTGDGLFQRQSDRIHGETLTLDMHISDHEMTFAMIEKSVKKLVNNLHVIRIKSNLARKRSIPELMESAKQSKRVFIIVEQAECMSRVLMETLVGHLKNRLVDETSPTDAVMILFCLSIKIQILPFDNLHCFGRMKGITKHKQEDLKSRVHELLESRNLKVKLAPDVLDFINLYSLNSDNSVTSISYLHCYAMFEHYHRLNEERLLSEKESELLDRQHQALCDDLNCCVTFLQESHRWPEDVSDLYEELMRQDHLALSEEFYNAVHGITKIPHDRLVARFEKLEKRFDKANGKRKDLLSIIMPYKEKIVNNKDCKEMVSKLVNDMLNYASKIKCPFGKFPNFYFDNRKALLEGCFTATRNLKETSQTYFDKSSYFGVLMEHLLQSPGSVAADELCDLVLEPYKRRIMAAKSPNENSQGQNPAPSPPKRSRRRTTIRATIKSLAREVAKEGSDKDAGGMDGLARAIFVDMIDSMEHQGIVKLDPRARGKVIKRLAWPVAAT